MNLNQAYMAGLMAATMVLIGLSVMRGMYPHRRLNLAVWLVALAAAAGFSCSCGNRPSSATISSSGR